MARRNICCNRGVTVGSSGLVPSDPTEFAGAAVVASVGCSRLRCKLCKAMVRNRAETALVGDGRAHVAELYETDDWLTLNYVERVETGRLYACRCTVFLEPRMTLMESEDHDPSEGDALLPWRCAGHALPKPPFDIDGVTIGPDHDFVELLASTARGEVPEAAAPSQRVAAIQWVYRVRERLTGLPLVDRFDQTMAQSLRSGDGVRIAQALLYFKHAPASAAFPEVLDALGTLEESAYADCDGDVWDVLSLLLARATDVGRRPDETDLTAIRRVRELALVPTTSLSSDHWIDLAKLDADWLARHATALAEPRPGGAAKLLTSLYTVERDELVVVAGTHLAHEADATTREQVRAWATENYYSFRPECFVLRQLFDTVSDEGVRA